MLGLRSRLVRREGGEEGGCDVLDSKPDTCLAISARVADGACVVGTRWGGAV